MTWEEMERTMTFIVEQQAHVTAKVDTLVETVGTLSGTVGTLARTVESLSGTVEKLSGKVDRTADTASALLAIAEIHDREIKETDVRLNALINTVERHISEGRNGKA
jgi:uncharacterized protein YoxC